MKGINSLSKNYLYLTDELSEILDVSPRTIYRWKRKGLKYNDSS